MMWSRLDPRTRHYVNQQVLGGLSSAACRDLRVIPKLRLLHITRLFEMGCCKRTNRSNPVLRGKL